MSTLGQPHPEPAWKQEVARRLAAHKNRKGAPETRQPALEHRFGSSVAAEAAARVAARYSKAPSYSQLQAEEARLAVRAAEIATQVALEAQAVAEEAIAELHAAADAPVRGPAVVESITRARTEPATEVAVVAESQITAAVDATTHPTVVNQPAAVVAPDLPIASAKPAAEPRPAPVYTQQVIDGRSFGIRWEPDTPVRVLQPKSVAPSSDPFELDTEDWWTPGQVSATLRNEPISVETEPEHANLIEFPRELVATRKMRPRLVEPAASVQERQLSIFEVDPGAVSTEPELVQEELPAWSDPDWSEPAWLDNPSPAAARSAREWSGPEWSGIELDEHPATVNSAQTEAAEAEETIHLAPIGYRLMAMAVDACLILGGFFAGAVLLAGRLQQPPAIHTTEILVALGLILTGFAYQALFCMLGFSTPGMRYAGIALCTFDEESPTRTQLRRRLGAMALSFLPMGLGLAWSVFDEDHLTWHDRISQTYLRRR
ncbi:MAG TPA: RDD family protein [Terracidiphilus sp.]|jgi:uncharacterized RDD family membrane protein YckC